MSYTTQHRTVLIIFPTNLTIIPRILSTRREGVQCCSKLTVFMAVFMALLWSRSRKSTMSWLYRQSVDEYQSAVHEYEVSREKHLTEARNTGTCYKYINILIAGMLILGLGLEVLWPWRRMLWRLFPLHLVDALAEHSLYLCIVFFNVLYTTF